MSAPSDEAAAATAKESGDRYRTVGGQSPKIWACEPARFKKRGEGRYRWYWLEVPPILFNCYRPTCDRCGGAVSWMGPPERRGDLLVYRIRCWCPREGVDENGNPWSANHTMDEIEVDWPLRVGGTADWWKSEMGVDV